MIAVIDYGAGNLRSVFNALEVLGHRYRVTEYDLAEAGGVLLPGVGHFGQMMSVLGARKLDVALREMAAKGVPILGICLGMQALFETSEEAPGVAGLGLVPGHVQRFDDALRVPHMGWNEVRFADGSSDDFYFANSYYAQVGESTTGVTEYGGEFSAVVRRDNVTGFQFHPEKSQSAGLRLIDAWCKAC